MNSLLDNLHLALPAFVILITACIALLCDLFIRNYGKTVSFYVACLGLLCTVGICYLFFGYPAQSLLNGLLIFDDITYLTSGFIALTVFLALAYARLFLAERQMPESDYYVLALFSTVGMIVLAAAQTLLILYLGLELLSLPLYAMTALRRTSANGSEAALKYFIMGAIASGMLLYGISLLYGATGSLSFTGIALAIHQSHDSMLLNFSIVFILAGLGFKLAAVPFHMWAPDVYEGAPSPVALLISSAPKIAVVGMVIRLLSTGLVDLTTQWQSLVLIMALLSTGFGNLFAIAQTNLRRLLAYSSISHMGYALFGVLAATPEGYSAALYYAVIYSLMSAAGFGLVVLLSKGGVEIESIEDLKGLNRRNPWLAFLMMIVLFSMAGVPPTVGFFTKLFVLKALVDTQFLWVAILGLVFAVIGAFYYIRVIKVMYFDAPKEENPIHLSNGMNLIFSVNSLALLLLGIFPSILVTACLNVFN